MGKLEAVTLAFLVQRTLVVDEGVDPADARTGVAENIEIHNAVTILAERLGAHVRPRLPWG
jgi:hypothetical protein